MSEQALPGNANADLSLRLTRRLETAERVATEALSGVLPLTFEQRARARLRARLVDGRRVGILLPRGAPLRQGDQLATDDGAVIEVRAAAEPLSGARSADAQALLRAAYHLGNRHVALQIEPDRLRWLHDHVLDAMVERLGLEVAAEQAPFEPEPGAYGDGHHHHAEPLQGAQSEEGRGAADQASQPSSSDAEQAQPSEPSRQPSRDAVHQHQRQRRDRHGHGH